MVAQALHARQIALGRVLTARDLPASCEIQTVHSTTGVRTTIATARCRVVNPRSAEGGEWLGDDRLVRILVPPATTTAGADLVIVTDPDDTAVTYRVKAQDPPRADDLLRALYCVAAREPGGPV